ncbi:MAG: protein kinase, partial [Planctomycetes bacterium]|nr:protein kinase [Planctomycetota bacterium]
MAKRDDADDARGPRKAAEGSRKEPEGAGDPESDEFLEGLTREGKGRIIGPVRLQSRISKGGMGIVYRGRHLKLDIDVAVKFLLPHLAEQNPEYVVRFEREARMAAQLNNENLVRVFDVDSQENYHYVFLGNKNGGLWVTLRARSRRRADILQPLSMEVRYVGSH